MIKKVELGQVHGHEVFGNPAPLGLFGLAIACAALTPIAFGHGLDPAGFKTAAIYALLFGAACQLLAGLMDFANKNAFGGTIFTAFSFNWMINAWVFWSAAHGEVASHSIVLAVEVTMFFTFLVLTYGFGFFSSMLFFFLLDIDFLYLCKVLKALSGSPAFNTPIAVLTVILGVIAMWIALGSLINPVAKKEIFKIGGPMFFAASRKRFDWSIRHQIHEVLYHHWKTNAYAEMRLEELEARIKRKLGDRNVMPDLCYLIDYGAVKATYAQDNPTRPTTVRLNSAGIDLYEQLILKKYDF